MRYAPVFALLLAIAASAARADAPPTHTLLLPVSPTCITSGYGPRGYVGPQSPPMFHTGIDLRAPAGAFVRAVAPGEVLDVRRTGAAGLRVDVRHPGGISVRYAHLGTLMPALANGARTVTAGEPIGRIGRTGVTYGTHLYLELRVNGALVDPTPYFDVTRCSPK